MRRIARAARARMLRIGKHARTLAVRWRRAARMALLPHVPVSLVRLSYLAGSRLGAAAYSVPGERTTCPACDASGVEHLRPLPLFGARDGRSFGFVTGCRHCGVIFANPLPSASELEYLYSPEGAWGLPRQAEQDLEKAPSVKGLVALFRPLAPGFDVTAPRPGAAALDFGCGSGEMLNILQEFGWATYGIEPAEKGAFVRHRELAQVPGEPMFDLAILHHVLEHVPNPLEILRALHRALRPDGLVLISVPRLDTLLEHREIKYCINARAHLLAYTRDALATLLAMAGFSAIDLNQPPGAGGETWKARRRLRMLGRRSALPVPAMTNPLGAAKSVLARWDAENGGRSRLFDGGGDVRVDAAVADFERRREKLRHRG